MAKQSGEKEKSRLTPVMEQFFGAKERYPDALLFFRMGDFYELFDDDAVTMSKALGLTLTQRTEGVPMAGIPYHQLENYLKRALSQGFRVLESDDAGKRDHEPVFKRATRQFHAACETMKDSPALGA